MVQHELVEGALGTSEASSQLGKHVRVLPWSCRYVDPKRYRIPRVMLTEQPWSYRPPFWKGGRCGTR